MMESLAGMVGLVLVGAITPGPNNLIVMHAASAGGWNAATRSIFGIVSGSLALLALAAFGVASLLGARPVLALYITVAGCVVLSALGIQLATGGGRFGQPAGKRSSGGQVNLWGLFAFQFLNPKAWVLVLTATSATQSTYGASASFLVLVPLFIVVPAACLLLWSALGVVMMRHLQSVSVRRRFDVTMGLLLCGSALLLLVDKVRHA